MNDFDELVSRIASDLIVVFVFTVGIVKHCEIG